MSSLEKTVANSFVQLAESMSPKLTGGYVNYVFEPINVAGRTLLKTREHTSDKLLDMVKQMILQAKQSTEVLDVLPITSEGTTDAKNRYLFTLLVAAILILLSFLIWITMIVLPCCARKRRACRTNKVCFYVYGAISLAFIVSGVLLSCITFGATGVLANKMKPDPTDSMNSTNQLGQVLATVFQRLPRYITEIIKGGSIATSDTISAATSTAKTGITSTVNTTLMELLSAYKARQLIDGATAVLDDMSVVNKTTSAITSSQLAVIGGLNKFQGELTSYRDTLAADFTTVCSTLTGDERLRCQSLQENLKLLDMSFNSSVINTESSVAMNGLVEMIGFNLTEIDKSFKGIDAQLGAEVTKISDQVSSSMNISQYFDHLQTLWDELDKSLGAPIQEQIDAIQPQVVQYNKQIYAGVIVLGFVTLAIAMIVLILSAIGVLAHIFLRKKAKAHCSGSCCLSFIFVIFGFAFLISTVVGIIVPILSLVHNEACRYGTQEKGVIITDTALNLWIDYEWPQLLQQAGGTQAALLNPAGPQNIFRAITVSCSPQENPDGKMGLLPATGIKHLINTTAIVDSPDITKVIADQEPTVVQAVLDANLQNLIPKDLSSVLKDIQTLTDYLDKSKYNESIAELNKGIDVASVNKFLSDTETFLDLLPPTAESSRMKLTIKSIRDLLTNDYPGLYNQSQELGKQYEELSALSAISPRLTSLTTDLKEVQSIVSDPELLKRPISPIYKNQTSQLLKYLDVQLDGILTTLTGKIFPCAELSIITTSVVNITCGNTGIFNLLGAVSTLITATTFFLFVTMLTVQIFVHCVGGKRKDKDDDEDLLDD